ncbi:glycosyltransferase family 1 protein [Lentibacillus sp. N15]|uniref:glycosyltransferase family 1 protein n=1 Tax=Lentibacillus songyuanensis TaxID=3136161 RepID=UPI0031BB5FE0
MGGPIRVLHVVVNMNRGGAETLIMNLYRNIDRTSVQFDFLTFKEGVFDAEIIKMGGKVYRIPYITDVGHIGFIKQVTAFLAAHPAYKMVHCHMDKMAGLVLRAAKKQHVPIRIAHSHNTKSEGGWLQRMYKSYAGSHVKRSATHFYACSQAASKWLFGAKSKQAWIVKNGIEADKFSYSNQVRKEMRRELGVAEDCFVLGHVGRFAPQKNHQFLVQVFAAVKKQLPNAVLILAGDGPLKVEISKTIMQLNLLDHVRFVGVRSDIEKVLQAVDLFVFPSLHEGLPVTLIEAQAAGLPCVIADTITKEVDLGVGLVRRLPLTDRQTWIKLLVRMAKQESSRKSANGGLANSGYDICQTAKHMQTSYRDLGALVT